MSTNSSSHENPDFDSAMNSLSSDLATLATLIEGKPREYLEEEPEELTIWKESAFISLQRLKDVVVNKRHVFTTSERSKIISVASIFVGQDAFIDNRCKTVAHDCLDALGPLDSSTASQVLLEHLKPIFQSAVHPGVRQDTGRVKHNPLDVQNMYDDQPWKTHGVGSWNVLVWVSSNIESESIESLWPLIIPPLLTLVDDHEPSYKLKGIMATDALLRKAPASLLRRTGIDELLFKALQGALQNLTSDQSPDLLRAAMPCYLALVDLVLPDDTAQRFDKLCELVTDTIVPGWLYASSRAELMIASVEVLSPVVNALGTSSARFLKAFIPQLTENLLPKEFSPVETTLALQLTSGKCLLVLMKNTRPRIAHWRHRILDAILRCWVDITDKPEQRNDALKELLVGLFGELLVSSGGLLEKELSTLKDLDAAMFSGLLNRGK
ncbi:hypothetical protein FRC08_011807 [Ceratobasidium sp. 394]|nr:hypothetical protein FRC08_011807 [Ceratobasidium sp. 394]KAG9102078.1 hypothetical protein FS749_016266 [Ceratobasidium sp. UAMH 11750]